MNKSITWGGIVSVEPFITISKDFPSTGDRLGMLGKLPDLFAHKQSLNFVTLSSDLEHKPFLERIVGDYVNSRRSLPLARTVLLTNTQSESELLSAHGVENAFTSELTFTPDQRFNVREPVNFGIEFDAVYTARLAKGKRHNLAQDVGSLLLFYMFEPDPKDLASYRQVLPNAVFGNHDFFGGQFNKIRSVDMAQYLHKARVGLCLSASEAAMRSSIEYALCGLGVLTTESTGGRQRYMEHSFAEIVEPSPEAVAEGLGRLLDREPEKHSKTIRASVMQMLESDRAAFMNIMRAHALETFSKGDVSSITYDHFALRTPQHVRPIVEALTPSWPKS